MQNKNLLDQFNPFQNILTHGVKTKDLRRMTTAELHKLFSLNHAYATRWRVIPHPYRAQPDHAAKQNARLTKNTNSRISRILQERGEHAVYSQPDQYLMTPKPEDYRGFLDNEFRVGDQVNAKFPDINTVPRVTVESSGIILKIETGKRGDIYHVRLDNDETRLLDKSCLALQERDQNARQ